MRLRAEARSRWRAWLGLALIIGVAGGAATAAAAGARRTETAYPRFVQAQNGYDLFLRGFPESNPERAMARIAALPEVAQWARIDIVAGSAILPSGRLVLGPELVATADLTGRAGVELNRFKVISGRMQNPRVPGEALVDFSTADREGLRVGSVVRFSLGNPAAPRKSAAVRVVGIVASPGQFPAVGASSAFGRIYVTPAFVRSNGITPAPDAAALLIRLRHGAADRGAFFRHLRAAGLEGLDIPFAQQTQTAGVQRSIRVESQALWVLCGLIALAALAILGQALGRQIYLDSADLPTLSALGMSRAQQAWLGIARAGVIGVAAACVVVPVAVLLSPLAPVGLARIAEPDPGFAADAVPLILGAVSVAVLTTVAAAIPARTVTMRTRSRSEHGQRPFALSGVLSPAWRSPAVAAGIRMALRPGQGRSAVPVRSAIFGVTLGVASLTASLVFATSLGHLLDTPRLSGFTWDAYLSVDGQHAKAAAALRSDPKVARYVRGGFTSARIGDVELMALTLGGTGPARPVITDGAAPVAGDEIALGPSTMRAAHTRIGQTVNLVADQTGGHPRPVRMRVVGTAIIPPNPYLATGSGEGAAIAIPGLARIDPSAASAPGALPFLVRFAPGVSREAGLAAVTNDMKGLPFPWIIAAERPANVASLARVADVPVLFSGLLALLAAGTLAHMLVTFARRRRHDLAMLKTLGFTRRQVRHAVAWQATVIAAIALLTGVPTGIAGGRWAWHVFAAQLGVLPELVIPVATILIAIPSALALANLVAALPARAAARTRPARVLRSE